MGVGRDGPVGNALLLPHYAATAWYHNALAPDLQQRDLDALLPEVEQFTLETYLPALAHGGFLAEERRAEIARQVARYSGLPESVVSQSNLVIPVTRFRKELLREQGFTVGRLDARYRGLDRDDAGITHEYDPALSAWNQAFTPAINHYLREVLGVRTERPYWIFGPVHPWNRTGDTTAEDLRRAMAENPYLHTLIQAGYYDGGTDYFTAKYVMWHLDPSGRLRNRLSFEGYRSGHMMYLRQEDLATSTAHVRTFIEQAVQATARPARY